MNNQVRFDKRVFPVEWTFNEQAKEAEVVPIHLEASKERLSEVGDTIYLEVLEGIISSEKANEHLLEAFYDEDEE